MPCPFDSFPITFFYWQIQTLTASIFSLEHQMYTGGSNAFIVKIKSIYCC